MGMDKEILEDAQRTIGILRSTVTALSRELEAAETRAAGAALTREAEDDRCEAQEKALAEKDALIAELKEELARLRSERDGGESISREALASSLQFYYDDFRSISQKKLTAEDADRLYGVLKYLFGELRRADIIHK